ncbi:MAG TPA: hypothetical protein VF610_09425, partial [Segetibacter sp.]
LAKEALTDKATEKLFLGRLYEGLSKGSDEDGNEKDFNFYANGLYEEYPQLLPFSGISLKMKLNTSGANDEEIQKVLKELKNCRVDWVDEADENTAMAFISFVKKGDRYEATVNAKSGSGKQKVKEEKMIFKETEGVGKELALRLFAKSGAMMYEKRDAGN